MRLLVTYYRDNEIDTLAYPRSEEKSLIFKKQRMDLISMQEEQLISAKKNYIISGARSTRIAWISMRVFYKNRKFKKFS